MQTDKTKNVQFNIGPFLDYEGVNFKIGVKGNTTPISGKLLSSNGEYVTIFPESTQEYDNLVKKLDDLVQAHNNKKQQIIELVQEQQRLERKKNKLEIKSMDDVGLTRDEAQWEEDLDKLIVKNEMSLKSSKYSKETLKEEIEEIKQFKILIENKNRGEAQQKIYYEQMSSVTRGKL
jgi:hypothetical protein